jgi:hypothetical protein
MNTPWSHLRSLLFRGSSDTLNIIFIKLFYILFHRIFLSNRRPFTRHFSLTSNISESVTLSGNPGLFDRFFHFSLIVFSRDQKPRKRSTGRVRFHFDPHSRECPKMSSKSTPVLKSLISFTIGFHDLDKASKIKEQDFDQRGPSGGHDGQPERSKVGGYPFKGHSTLDGVTY